MGKKSRRRATKAKKAAGGGPAVVSPTNADSNASDANGYLSDHDTFGVPPSPENVAAFWECFLDNEEEIHRLALQRGGTGVDAIGDILFPKMLTMAPNLGFEYGPVPDDDGNMPDITAFTSADDDPPVIEFCVHADGTKEQFNAVLAISRAAPSAHTLHHRWQFVGFKPRQPKIMYVSARPDDDGRYGYAEEPDSYGFRIERDETSGQCRAVDSVSETRPIRYALTRDARMDKVGIVLFMRGYDDCPDATDHLDRVAFHLLDGILGEYDVEMHLGLIDRKPYGCEEFEIAGGGAPLELLAEEFDARLAEKMGPKPKGGWMDLTL